MCSKSMGLVATNGRWRSAEFVDRPFVVDASTRPGGYLGRQSSEYDFIYDRIHGTVSWRGESQTPLIFG
jgi:hypothetical protein